MVSRPIKMKGIDLPIMYFDGKDVPPSFVPKKSKCPLGTRQIGKFCVQGLPKPVKGMKVLTLREIHTVKMGKEEWIKLSRIDIPKHSVGTVTYVAGIGSPEFHVKWNLDKKRPETIEEDVWQTRDEIAQIIKKLR